VVVGGVAGEYDIIPKVSTREPGGADTNADIVSQAGSFTYYTRQGDPTSVVHLPAAVDWHYLQVGGYAEAVHRFPWHMKAIAGVRVDGSTHYKQVPVSPRAALVYNGIDERLTFKYIFSMAYIQPAAYFENNVFDNGVQIASSNPSLQPEQAFSNEINATWQDKQLLASVSAYYNHQSNLIITSQSDVPQTVVYQQVFLDLNPPAPDRSNTRRVTQSINLGSSTALGFDIFGRYSVGPVSTWGSYSYVDFSQNVGGVETGLPQISRHNVRAGVTWAILPNLSVTPSLILRSTPENLGPYYQNAGVSMTAPYLVNANALYSPIDPLDVFVTGHNITNNHYGLRGVAGPQPQEPISVLVGLRLRL
jgi:outer membrane receptor for ferrienterochelin and colicin